MPKDLEIQLKDYSCNHIVTAQYKNIINRHMGTIFSYGHLKLKFNLPN